jgi:hypothetical protein
MTDRPENELATRLLNHLRILFPKHRRIQAIQVSKGQPSMWVRQPDKIKFWQQMAKHSANAVLFMPGHRPRVVIKKVVYDG